MSRIADKCFIQTLHMQFVFVASRRQSVKVLEFARPHHPKSGTRGEFRSSIRGTPIRSKQLSMTPLRQSSQRQIKNIFKPISIVARPSITRQFSITPVTMAKEMKKITTANAFPAAGPYVHSNCPQSNFHPLSQDQLTLPLTDTSHCRAQHRPNLRLRPDSRRPIRAACERQHCRANSSVLREHQGDLGGGRVGLVQGGQVHRVSQRHGQLCGDEWDV